MKLGHRSSYIDLIFKIRLCMHLLSIECTHDVNSGREGSEIYLLLKTLELV